MNDCVVWVHAVSVGEVIAAKSIVETLMEKRPDYRIVISTGTPTGRDTVARLFGQRVTHYYQPYDLGNVIRRFVTRLNPELLIVMETELWPNMFHYCRKGHVPVVLANSRMSARSANRYQYFKQLTCEMLNNVNAICCQTEQDAERLISLGASQELIEVTGSVKFDIHVADEIKEKARHIQSTELSKRKTWIAASTHLGEEQLVIDIHRTLLKQFPDCVLILAPRHSVRGRDITRIIKSNDMHFVARSSGQEIDDQCSILLLDTMGELILFYAIADIAFVGGSLVEHGGHNPIEPAYFSKPVLFGPYDFNFSQINQSLINQQAAVRVNNQSDLLSQLQELFNEPEKANLLGQHARRFIDENKGATEKVWNIIGGFLD